MKLLGRNKLFRCSVAALFGLLVVACDRQRVAPPPERVLSVVAMEFPLGDLARLVGGDRVQVDWILSAGDPLANYSLSRSDQDRVRQGDLVFGDGHRTEPWAAGEFGRMRDTGALVLVEHSPIARTAPTSGVLYLDPVLGKEAVNAIAGRLINLQPRYSDDFRQRARDVIHQIDVVLADYPNSAFGRGKLVLLGPTFAPLLDRFGVASVTVDADPLRITPDAAREIRAKASEAGAKVVIVPFDTPPGTRENLAMQTGLTVFALDPLGYRNFQEHGSYLELARFNLEQLKQATLR